MPTGEPKPGKLSAEQIAKILSLRLVQKLKYRVIAERLGVSIQTVHKVCKNSDKVSDG